MSDTTARPNANAALGGRYAIERKMEEISDQDLMVRIREGNRHGYRVLFKRYWPPLVGYSLGIVGAVDDAEDVVQDTFAGVWRHRLRWTSSGSVSAYLYRITRNLSLNRRRNAQVERTWKDQRGKEAIQAVPPRTPLEDLNANSLSRKVDAAIEALPERRREIFILSRYHGLTYREIADAMEISPQTVANQMGTALVKLRGALSHRLEES